MKEKLHNAAATGDRVTMLSLCSSLKGFAGVGAFCVLMIIVVTC